MFRNNGMWITGAAFAQLWMLSTADAALISAGTTAPTVDGADIAQLVGTTDAGGDQGHLWADRPVQGQIFVTGSNPLGYALSAVTLGNLAAQPNPASVWEVRVGTITGGSTFTEIAEEATSASPGAIAANSYITLTFSTPVVLSPNTIYGFDVGVEGSGIVTANAADDTAYAGGSAYSMDDNSDPANIGPIAVRSVDRVFHVNLTAVPEPASAAVLGSVLLGLLARRRRQRVA